MTTRKYSSRSQQTTLAANLTDAATTCTVVSGSALLGGATVPAGTTFTVVIDPDTALEEIVDVTIVSTNVLTITRGVENSGTGQAHSAGAAVRHMAIGRDFREANLHIEATGGYNDGTGAHTMHGIASGEGDVVGTLKTQTLTNKTLTAPTITNPSISGAGVDATITFEGATADAHETFLTVAEPTQDNTITLPNTTGTVVIATAVQTLTNKTMGDALNAGGFKITNLATPTDASDAVRKDFADAQVAAAATSAASAASSATAAASSATTAAASVATIAGYASAAATSATSASASATAAATSATSAATSAGSSETSAIASATSASASASSATAAATSATSAAASATAAATSATSSAASATAAATSATSAAASATTAANSVATIAGYATSSANSATAAATSATSAAASATAASTSAASAATSATSAATTYDEFDDRYLGSKSSAPTVDNDGNTLLVGAIYWNSTLGNMYVWSGTAWVQIATTSVYTAPTLGSTSIGSGATVTNVNGLTINSTTIPTSATLAKTADKLSVFAATTSAELAGVISDETGSGALVFATSPTLITPVLGVATGTSFNSITALSSTTPIANGTAAVGTETTTARGDHVHPTTGLGLTASGLNQFAATTSAQLLGVISDETGTGSLVFGTSPTITPAEGTTSTAATGAGYMGIPQNATTTGAATIAATDAGKHIYSTATRTLTIPANSSVALPVGTTITFIAGSGATVTIAITTDTMYLAGPGTTGSRTLAAFGMATAVKIASTTWIISGNGLT